MSAGVRHSLLGILSLCPMSGYDIEKFVGENLSYFWKESYSQIYPSLKKMTELKLVRVKRAGGKLDRRVYSITDAGRAEVARWLAEAPEPPSPRNEVVLKVFFARYGALEDLARHVEALRAQQAGAARRYDGIEEWLKREQGESPDLPFWLISIDYGRRYSKFLVEWADATLARLKKL